MLVFTVVQHPDHFQVMLPEFIGIKVKIPQTEQPEYYITLSVIQSSDTTITTPLLNTTVVLTECSGSLMCSMETKQLTHVKLLAQK